MGKHIKRSYVFLAIVVLLIILARIFFLDLSLLLSYPHFLNLNSPDLDTLEKIDTKIEPYLEKESYDSSDMKRLLKLLWMKKDYSKAFSDGSEVEYLSETERSDITKKAALFVPMDIEDNYVQINMLKYKLGHNDIDALEGYIGPGDNRGAVGAGSEICSLFLDETDWTDLYYVNIYFQSKHFCKVGITKGDKRKLEQALLRGGETGMVEHLREHGINSVSVNVNSCETDDLNERYHCLFFT
jgi:hypothetical protein